MEFLCLGFCSSNVGLYTKAVTEALNIKRSVYSLAHSLRYVTQVLVAFFFGTMVNRFGVKKLVAVCYRFVIRAAYQDKTKMERKKTEETLS